MTTVEKLYAAMQGLPEPMIAEVLDFAEFLRMRNLYTKPTDGQSLLQLSGGLENSATFAVSATAIQEKLRNEWN